MKTQYLSLSEVKYSYILFINIINKSIILF